MFNRAASNPKNKPDELLNVLKLRQGQVVADIGAGGGYFSLRFAEIESQGNYYERNGGGRVCSGPRV